jgi:hypothetical protein
VKTVYLNAFENDSDKKLCNAIKRSLRKNNTDICDVVILCIGTDRATGDCLGPLVGNHLKTNLPNICVFGTLEHPVHALNLEETLETIYN